MKKTIAIIALLMSLTVVLASCGKTQTKNTQTNNGADSAASQTTSAPETTLDPKLKEDTVNITITLTTGEQIKAELYPDIAPISVENFVKLANENFYDGLIFHRVIPGFMIQGGGYTADMEQKHADSIKGEFSDNGVENNLKHTRGVLSMARTPDPDSASSQFFIMHADYPYLDGQYAAFGEVTEGLEVVDRIAETETTTIPELGMSDVPVEPVVIQSITVD